MEDEVDDVDADEAAARAHAAKIYTLAELRRLVQVRHCVLGVRASFYARLRVRWYVRVLKVHNHLARRRPLTRRSALPSPRWARLRSTGTGGSWTQIIAQVCVLVCVRVRSIAASLPLPITPTHPRSPSLIPTHINPHQTSRTLS